MPKTSKTSQKNRSLSPIIEIIIPTINDITNSSFNNEISTFPHNSLKLSPSITNLTALTTALNTNQNLLADDLDHEKGESFESCSTDQNQFDLSVFQIIPHNLINIQPEAEGINNISFSNHSTEHKKYFYVKFAIGVAAATSLIIVNCIKDNIYANRKNILFGVNLSGVIGLFFSVCSIAADERNYIKHVYNNVMNRFSLSFNKTASNNQNDTVRFTHSLNMSYSSNSHFSISESQKLETINI